MILAPLHYSSCHIHHLNSPNEIGFEKASHWSKLRLGNLNVRALRPRIKGLQAEDHKLDKSHLRESFKQIFAIMAPLPTDETISDLALSSLELDSRTSTPVDLPTYLLGLSPAEREALTASTSSNIFKRDAVSVLSPEQVYNVLNARSTPRPTTSINPAAGSIPPDAINMKGIQALFALIGASFVLGAIWFFFWAKNGGFKWQKNDWEDYKSTVLRRKGPNGTTLSNATKSTRLGNGSVVGKGYSDADGMTDFSSEAPTISEKKRAKNQKAYLKNLKKENAREQKAREAREAGWEGGHDDDVRAYRHEKVAKVGGINTDSEALHYGTDYSETTASVSQPRSSRDRRDRRERSSRHASPTKIDPRRGEDLDEPQRPARYHSPSKESARTSNIPGAFSRPAPDWDVQTENTKAYHHPLPTVPRGQKKAGGGFRRDRGDDLDD
jgi:hypothetical protein